MNKTFLILGVIVAIVGIGGYVDSEYTHIILTGTHHTIPLAGLGLTVLGALIAVGGLMMGRPAGGASANQFKCDKCGAVFGSQTALAQHSKDKHGISPS